MIGGFWVKIICVDINLAFNRKMILDGSLRWVLVMGGWWIFGIVFVIVLMSFIFIEAFFFFIVVVVDVFKRSVKIM